MTKNKKMMIKNNKKKNKKKKLYQIKTPGRKKRILIKVFMINSKIK